MFDCLIITKPGFEWMAYIKYLVPVVGLIFAVKNWKKWKLINVIVYVLSFVFIFVIVAVLTFVFTPTVCAGWPYPQQ